MDEFLLGRFRVHNPFIVCEDKITTGEIYMADYEGMSNEELYLLLKEKAPDVAAVAGEVRDSNRNTVIAFLVLLSDEEGHRSYNL